MRIFKHGDALAIVFPQSAVSSSGLKEEEELEFVETEKGVFVLLRKEKLAEMARQKADRVLDKPFGEAGRSKSPSNGLKAFFKRELESKGFVVVFNEDGAKQVSEEMAEEIRSGAVVGSRGFDKRFYVCTKEFIQRFTPKVLSALKETSLSPEQVAEKTKLSDDAVKAILCILMDEGEIIEKKKGVFIQA
ncbi:MAG: hypothetical protein V1717_04600 [Candidatus Micrarchaeota archaeon]